jgi:hypothetical protein
MLTISGKALGSRKPLFADFSIPPPAELTDPGDGGVTLRDVITRVVEAEVDAFNTRQQRRKLTLVLSPAEIEAGLEKGRVEPGEREGVPQRADPEQAVGAALEAFEDGIYLVAIDGEEKRNLDEQVYLQPDSRLTFIRLTLLAGA